MLTNTTTMTNLKYGVHNSMSRYYDFGNERHHKDWEVIYPSDESVRADGEYKDLEDAIESDPDYRQPIFNHLYPFPSSCGSRCAADKLIGTNMTVVEVDGETHLALTGCGMDMSWYICKAYVAIGYYPPFEFCNLPNMGEIDKDVLNACEKTCEAVRDSASAMLENLGKLNH